MFWFVLTLIWMDFLGIHFAVGGAGVKLPLKIFRIMLKS